MKINILIPYKEKFEENKAASVSITIKSNLSHTSFLGDIKIYGQNVQNPLFKDNFVGISHSVLSFKSKNKFLADQMLKVILKSSEKRQLIEIHNRPYLVQYIYMRNKTFPISLFLHNDPKMMKGSKSIKERKNILEKCSAIFCVSKYIKKQFLDGLSISSEKVHVLYNGVDRKLKKFPTKKKEIIFVGRLVQEKGVHLYTDAIKSIATNYPEWQFGLIGSFRLGDKKNDNSYAQEIIKKFNSIGSQANFYGFKDRNFVDNKMKTASIIIIPSVWQEPFGLVAAEAMSNGIAIIASRVGGLPEIIEDNGILIENLTPKIIEKNIIKLLEDKNKREFLQKKSWENFKFLSSFSSKKLDEFRKLIFKTYF